MHRTNCPHCAVPVSYRHEMAGKPGCCPKCKTAFTIPAAKPEQPWYAEAAAQATPATPAPVPVAQVAPPPVAQVVPPVAKVAKVVKDIPFAEEDEPPRLRRRREEKRPWYSVKVGGVLGGLGTVIAILVGIYFLNKSGTGPNVFGPSKSDVQAEAVRVMNANGISITSVELVEESRNKYVGIARDTNGQQYKVHVTCDGEKILVEWRPNLNWP